MRGQELLSRLREEVIVGDGALGTMISERGIGRDTSYERLNLTHPQLIKDIHSAYLNAGAEVLESNTFAANRTKLALDHAGNEVSAVNRAGVALAREAINQAVPHRRAYVAGSVGPLLDRTDQRDLDPLSDEQRREIFREQITALADAGADLLLLETFSDLKQLLLALEVARKHTDLPIACQLAFHERGHTYTGAHVSTAVESLVKAGADVIGTNCGRGVRCVVSAVEYMTGAGDFLVSAFPNAGLPEYRNGRYIFGDSVALPGR